MNNHDHRKNQFTQSVCRKADAKREGRRSRMPGYEIRDQKPDRKDTHLVKQSFSKEIREAMTEEQLKSIPILGSLTVGTSFSEPDPVSSADVIGPTDDLPW